MRPVVYTVLFLAGVGHCAFGQITIPQSAIEPMFTPSNYLQIHIDTTADRPTVDVGLLGGPHVYDFSALKFDLFHTDTIRTVSEFPHLASRFPSAGAVMTIPYEDGIGFEQAVVEFQNGRLQEIGEYSKENDSTVKVQHDNEPEAWFSFPITYGDSIRYQHDTTDSTFVNGSLSNTGGNSFPVDYLVDGYGTLTVPGGESFDCLRIRKQEYEPHNYRAFWYVTPNGLMLVVDSRNSSGIEGEVVNDGVFLVRNSTLTSVKTAASSPYEFALEQNYPNPFNPVTRIRFRLQSAEFVTLEVIDQLGRIVSTLVNETRQPGLHVVDWNAVEFPTGVYYYRLEAGTHRETKKLMLIR